MYATHKKAWLQQRPAYIKEAICAESMENRPINRLQFKVHMRPTVRIDSIGTISGDHTERTLVKIHFA
jgi:hypothetical protein